MKLSMLAGTTSQSINVFLQDATSTTGGGKTGLVFNTSGLTAYYSFAGANATSTSISLVTLATVTTAWTTGGFKELDATNMPGVYRLDLPNAAIAASKGRSVMLYFQGATGLAPAPIEIELTGWDNQDAVHAGLSALPNTAVTTNASLLTSGTGTDQVSVSAGKLLLQATQPGVTIPTVTTVGTLTTYTGNTVQTGDSFARLGAPLGASIDADILSRLATSGYTAPPTAAAIATAVLTDTGDNTTTGSPGKILSQLGGAFTTTSSSVYSTASLANAPTGGTAPTATQIVTAMFTDLLSSSDFSTASSIGALLKANTVASVSGAVGSVTGSVGSIAGVTFPTRFSALSIDVSGDVTFNNTSLSGSVGSVSGAVGSVTGNVGGNVVGSTASVTGAVGSVTAPVSVSLTQALSAARALDTIADTSLTLNDALHCAIAGAAGKQSVISLAYTIETPHTGTVLRTFAIDSATAPTERS